MVGEWGWGVGGGTGGFGGLVLIIRHCETARKEIPPKDEHANGATHLSRATTYRRQHLMNEQIDHIWKPSRSLSLALSLSLLLSLALSLFSNPASRAKYRSAAHAHRAISLPTLFSPSPCC